MENVKIVGAGIIQGGEYDEVKVSGSASVQGNIECNVYNCAGASSIKGNLKAKELKSSGSIKIDGSLEGEIIKISGAGKVIENLNANTLTLRGAMTVEGDTNVDVLDAKITNGSFRNIYGDVIQINSEGGFVQILVLDSVKSIRVKEIEATTICIRDVIADRVSGENVCIESGCHIDVVEYSKKLDVSAKARIDKIIKL